MDYRFWRKATQKKAVHDRFKRQFVVIIVLSALVLLQGFTHIIALRLDGYVSAPAKTEFSLATYRDGSYMDYLSKLADSKGGFREFFIRAYNQMQYTIYGKSTNNL